LPFETLKGNEALIFHNSNDNGGGAVDEDGNTGNVNIMIEVNIVFLKYGKEGV
jgi:hypothetical protein